MKIEQENYKKISLFALGFAGIYIIVILFSIFNIYGLIYDFFYIDTLESKLKFLSDSNLILNYSIYYVIFLIMLPIIGSEELKKITSEFKIKENIAEGISLGIILVSAQVLYNLIIGIFFPNITSNANESGVDNIINSSPFLAFIAVGIIGPIVEEATYRYGLFSFIKQRSRFLAYFVTILIFSLIHFELNLNDINALINEVLNLPSYIIGAVILCYAYDKNDKISVSITAHIFNNATSALITIFFN